MTRKELTDAFNSLSVEERKQFLQTLSQTEYKKFIKDLGDQAVQDYWDNERELIKQGKGTRDWTVEQQNTILNIGKNGQELKHAQAPKDINGKTYEGQHMFSKNEYPEYAGDYHNIQGLTFDEHRTGAHGNGGTQIPTKGYYDEITGQMFDFTSGKIDTGYPPAIDLSELADGITPTNRVNYSEIIPFYDDLTIDQQIELRRARYVWEQTGQNVTEPDFYKYIVKNGLNASDGADNFIRTVSDNIITDADNRFGILNDVRVDIDTNGKITNVDFNSSDIPIDTYPNSMSATEYKAIESISDTDMRAKYPDFDSRTDMEKFAIKAQEGFFEKYKSQFDNIDVSDSEALDYARKLGKNSIGELTDDDMLLYKAGKWASNSDGNMPLGMVDDLGKFKKLNKFAKAAPIIGSVFVLIEAGFVIHDVCEAYENNGLDDAAVVLTEGIAGMAVEFGMDLVYDVIFVACPPAGAIIMAIDFISGGAITDFAKNLVLSVIDFVSGKKFGGSEWDDILYGNSLANTIYGKGGDDTIYGGTDNDILYGEKGNDTLYGEEDDDVLYGDADFDEYFNILDGDNVYVGDDNLYGGEGNDYIYGGGGNDYIEGGSGNDVIYGEDGDDEIYGDSGENYIEGGAGNDKIYGGTELDYILGGDNDDKIWGGSGTDYIEGNNGNDEIRGEEDQDEVHGGEGTDTIWGGTGDDFLYGDEDNDIIYGENDRDHIEGGDGNDELYGGDDDDELFGNEGDDTLYGDAGNDYLESGNGNNTLYGGDGDDTLVSGEDTDYMYGGTGNDYFIGGNGANYMYGEDGDDRLQGGEGYDYMEGGLGSDNMSGGNGDNEMYGQEGNDFIYGGNDNDYIDGGVGNDELYGGNGNNTIYGQEGDDIIYDGDDGSHIYGGTGNDTIRAGGGNDVIDAGEGDDYIQDDHGDDTIIFKAGYGTDTISDAAGNNTIELSGLSIEDAVMSRINGSDLNISFGTDNIIIKQYFDGAGFQNFNINGTMINDLITTLHGSDADDWLSAWSDNGVTMNGEGGNDTLNGGNGDDVLEGGTGNDFLNGNSGNDTYIFSKNSGNDTIEDWNGSSLVKLTDINIDEISISKMNDSTLVLTIDSTGDTLTVNGYKWNQGGYTFEFADGTTDSINKDTWKWGSGFGSTAGEDTPPEQNIMNGTSGNDNIYGTDGNDIINGSAGNDTLCGGNGEDTYIFAKGYEADTINEWGSDHSIIQLTDINSDEVTITDQWGSNLILTVNGTNDTLTISNYKWGQSSYTFEFADGAVATVNKDTWELEFSQLPTAAQSEEEVIQSNADLLSDIYADDIISSDLLTETDSTVISEVSDSASVSDENEEIADQTDLQVMILTENMAAFATEDNISDSTNITDTTDASVMNQLLVGTQVQ